MPNQEDEPNSNGDSAEMIVTGVTRSEVEGNGESSGPPDQCYLCKRKAGSKSIIMVKKPDDEKYALIDNELKTGRIERMRSGGRFIYNICFECVILFDLK